MQIKNLTWLWMAMIAACLITTDVFAQRPGDEREGRSRPERGREGRGFGGRGGPGGGPGGGRGGFSFMRMLPLMVALDADEDGEISAKEIENAVVALKKLDKNKDGKLTEDELRPNFGGRGFGGPGGPPGGGRGFGGPGGGSRGSNPEQIVERFMRMDENKDGKLQKDEIPERMQSVFARADANKDDVVTKEELTKMAEQMAAGGGREGRGGGFGGGRGGEGGGRGGRGGDRPRRPQRPE